MNSNKASEMVIMEEEVDSLIQEETDIYVNEEPNYENLEVVWFNVYYYVVLHLAALYGFYQCFFCQSKTLIWGYFLYVCTGLGITAGAHRLWAHRSYKAKLPLEILLVCFNSLAGQNDAIEWCRDHRVHHKYSETDADPHNANRGFFFSHMGWLMCKKHKDVKTKGKNISISDLESNPILAFQRRFYMFSVFIFCVLIPTIVPWYFWSERIAKSFFINAIFRYVFVLHSTWLVNSWAHLVGNRPYDENISPSESLLVSTLAVGEGFHNYHHVFPYDYSTSELGMKLNLTTSFINLMSWLGLAYDLKAPSKKVINDRKKRTGDRSLNAFHPYTKFIPKSD